MPLQVVELGTMDLVAQTGGEDALFSTRLYLGAGKGHTTFPEGWLPMAPVTQIRSSGHHRDNTTGQERTAEVLLEAMSVISAAAPRGAA